MSDTGLQVGFVLFPRLMHLDFAGPWDVLANLPGATLHVVAKDRAPIISSSGLATLPTTTFAECPQLDLLCVPGGGGHLQAMEDEETLDFLRRQEPGCRFVTAVCTGALVLAAAGLLKGYKATTHWNSHDRLAAFGAIPEKGRVVVDRNRITGGGVTAGIDFGLTMLAALQGEAFARRVQLGIEYAPEPPFPDGGSPDTAEPATVEAAREATAGYRANMAEVDARVLSRLAQATS
ncbi:cyclohexyl-isocyanide hydratase [Acetobacteraceae bacterium AT-5844]|nr:cyclohexyl-isocyanide hydratase [Acetobacteraceae bacterium AT-5844]